MITRAVMKYRMRCPTCSAYGKMFNDLIPKGLFAKVKNTTISIMMTDSNPFGMDRMNDFMSGNYVVVLFSNCKISDFCHCNPFFLAKK